MLEIKNVEICFFILKTHLEDKIRNISQQWFGIWIMRCSCVYYILYCISRNNSHTLVMSSELRQDTDALPWLHECLRFSPVFYQRKQIVSWRLSCFLSPPPEGSLSDSSAQPSSAPGSLNNSTWASILQSPFLFFLFFFLLAFFSFLALSTFLLAPEPLR